MISIVFDHASKAYPGAAAPAVDDVSLEITAGQTVVILGTSGAGKTTLLKMVNRLIEPTSGRVFVQGSEIRALPATELRRRIGYVIQQVGLFPHWTVAENVATVPRVLGWPPSKIRERVDFLLELLRLPPGEFRRRYPSQLSGGQQQRVGIARALAADPETLLMDEPFGAADAITRGHLQDEFLALQRRTHKTVLFVTHDVEEALHLADRLIVMDRGSALQYDTPFNIIAHPADRCVAELVGADDIMRLLRLIAVRSVMQPLLPEVAACGREPVGVDESVRDALAKLLCADCDALPVVDSGVLVGQVALKAVREQLRRPIAPEPRP